MKKFIDLAIDKKNITLFLALLLTVMGCVGFYLLPRQESPDVSFPAAMVITPYPGASAKDVNDLVTTKIEDKLYEIDGYDYIKSFAKESMSIVVVFFDMAVDNDTAMQEVRNAVKDAENDLPSGVQDSIIDTDLVSTAGMVISLSGDAYSYEQLASFGEQFKTALTDVDGVSKFTIEGELDKEVHVDVDINMLNQMSISIEDLAKILAVQNVEIPSGSIEQDGVKINVKTPGIYTSIEDIENSIISISPDTGVVTRLKDIANVYMDVEDGVTKFKQNGDNAVLLTGYFEDSKNVVLIGKEVRETLDRVKASLPENLVVEEVIYQPEAVAKSTGDFMNSLIQGILLVVVVVFIGMGLRNAAVVSTAIPFSIMLTFGVMYITGLKIHQISLTALIIALGILVDNAIVISDSIQVEIDKGLDSNTAAKLSTQKASIPVFTATVTTVLAFSPLLGLPGAAGSFLKAIPLVLIISIVAAYLVAMLVTPALSSLVFKPSKKKNDKPGRVRTLFENMLKYGLKRKMAMTLAIFIALASVLVFVTPKIESEFFPYVDKDLFYIDIRSEIPGNLEATEILSDEVVDLLSSEPEITSYTVAVGDGIPKFYITMPPATPSKDFAQMLIKFDLDINGERRYQTRDDFAAYIQKQLDEKITAGKCTVNRLQNAEPQDAKIIMRIAGTDVERVDAFTRELTDRVREVEGTMNVRNNLKPYTFQFEVDIDSDKSSSMGMTKYDIQKQMNIALYGYDASVYRRDGKEYNIVIEGDMDDTQDIETFMVKSSLTDNKIPMHAFSTVNLGKKIDNINRYDRKIASTVLADTLPSADPSSLTSLIENDILPTLDQTGVQVTFDGERESIQKYFGVAGGLAVLAILLIYVTLVIQFDSFLQPVIILMTIPLSLIGSILGLYFLHQPMSLTAVLGIIALIGLVVKNGILLIEYINEARDTGVTLEEACIDAVDKRFNAIILSAGTTVMGLIPLALSNSSLFAPMAVSLMSGLIVSTFLTMVIIPVMFCLVIGAHEKHLSKKVVRNLKPETSKS